MRVCEWLETTTRTSASAGPRCRSATSCTACTATPPSRTVSDTGMSAAYGAVPLLPRTTLNGAIAASRASISGPAMSPPWTMW